MELVCSDWPCFVKQQPSRIFSQLWDHSLAGPCLRSKLVTYFGSLAAVSVYRYRLFPLSVVKTEVVTGGGGSLDG